MWKSDIYPRSADKKGKSFDEFWLGVLQNGAVEISGRRDRGGVPRAFTGTVSKPKAAAAGDGYELVLYTTAHIGDGRYANISWLQELPENSNVGKPANKSPAGGSVEGQFWPWLQELPENNDGDKPSSGPHTRMDDELLEKAVQAMAAAAVDAGVMVPTSHMDAPAGDEEGVQVGLPAGAEKAHPSQWHQDGILLGMSGIFLHERQYFMRLARTLLNEKKPSCSSKNRVK